VAAAPGSVKGNREKIYISYSRRDAVISGRISDELMRAGFEVFLDRSDIAVGEDWRKRLEELIRQADKVVVLLSPDATSSIQVARDVETAAHYGKGIVPVLVRNVQAEQVPRDVAKLNFVFMRDETEIDRGMPALLLALATNMAWVREQTRINDMAVQWNTNRNVAFLLRGEALSAAERWLVAQPTSAPPVTLLQKEFIEASREAQLRLRRRMQRSVFAFAGFFALISIIATYQWVVADRARVVAESQRFEAERQQSEAERQRSEAERAQAVAERERAAAQELAAQLSASSDRIKELQEALRQVDSDNPLLKR
jgi:TIR domain